MNEYDEVDFFESQYADELDLIGELEDPEISTNKVELPTKKGYEEHVASQLTDDAKKRVHVTSNENNEPKGPARKKLCFDDGDDNSTKEDESFKMLFFANREIDISSTNIIPKKACVFRRVPDGKFLPVTGQNNTRVYLKMKPKTVLNSETVLNRHSSRNTNQMLSKPYHELYADIQEQSLRKTKQREMQNFQNGKENKVPTSGKLWVEEYKPKNFIHLLSDDGTNRTLLEWLKLWDKVVFNREKLPSRRPKIQDDKKKLNDSKFRKFSYKKLPEISKELDSFNRPLQKIALLCGPPGLGKTTLAHIIAKHAGYNVVEMNASDDRTVDVFRSKIEAATQMKSVLSTDPRPNCLVIDEIDGSLANSINLLIQMTKATGKSGAKKKKKDGHLLTRPIICICNDQFVPALKPLRLMSLVLNFPPTISSRLATRLLEISRNENLTADINTLYVLCKKAENDIRSCLATLQFVSAQKKKLSMSDVISSSVGQKDEQKSLFTVWQAIFSAPRAQKKSMVNPHDLKNMELSKTDVKKTMEQTVSKSSRVNNILSQCYSCGETEKLVHGMFENYLQMKFKEPQLTKVTNGLDWLCFYDVLNQEIRHTQNYILMPYLPYTCAAFHFMFSVLNPPRIIYPTMDIEHRNNQAKMLNVITAMFADLPSQIRAFANTRTLTEDILPFLMTIVQPQLRPINTQLYSNKEKMELDRLISTMVSYNLTYRQERDESGQFVYLLEPNVEELTVFPGIKSRNLLTYTMRQLVAREIELSKIKKSQPEVPKQYVKPKETEKVVPNHKQVLNPKEVDDLPLKAQVDFFGRIVKQSHANPSPDSKQNGDGHIWFKFKAGFNNAVRKKVRMQDLL